MPCLLNNEEEQEQVAINTQTMSEPFNCDGNKASASFKRFIVRSWKQYSGSCSI